MVNRKRGILELEKDRISWSRFYNKIVTNRPIIDWKMKREYQLITGTLLSVMWHPRWEGSLGENQYSVKFICSVVSDSLWHHGLQHARLPCPSPTPAVYSNSCPLSWWCHPTILSSVVPFFSCLQSFPASGSFQMS